MTKNRTPRIAIDISQIDRHTLNAGQYRYAIDLVREMAGFDGEMDILILGSRSEPVAELADLFDLANPHFQYHSIVQARGKASYYRDLWHYGRWLRANRVDVFHQLIHYLPPIKHCRYVVTHYDCVAHHADDRGLLDSRPYRYYQWALRRLADRVISISDASKADAIKYFRLSPDRITTVPLGLSRSFVLDAATLAHTDVAPFILAPFNLEPYKNLTGLLKALPAILAAHQSFRLLLYGNSRNFGDRQARFEAECRDLDIEHAVTRLGFVSDQRLRTLYATAAIFVFPTVLEGFGYPLLEAMACGACCVTTAGSAMQEVGSDSVCYADTRNPAALADAILHLLGDDARRQSLSAAAMRRARQFTVEDMARRTLDCYRDLLR